MHTPHYRLDTRTHDVHHHADSNTFNYYVNGGHWQIEAGSDIVFMYDIDGALVNTYATPKPVSTLLDFDRVVGRMMSAGVTP